LVPNPAINEEKQAEAARQLSGFHNFLSFKVAPHVARLITLPSQYKIRAFFSGNQGGKSASCAYDYVLRLCGMHPVKDRNRLARHIRCLGPNLPESKDASESDSQQYLELKRLLPPEMILQDISARNKTMTLSTPLHGKSYIEFMSFNQELQSQGGSQRSSIWEDEEPPRSHREESKMRLLAENGDETISLTPTNGLSYLFDEVFSRAGYRWNSPTIRAVYGFPLEELIAGGSQNIACLQIATDDNPTFDIGTINAIFSDVDPDEVPVRRYGVFKQITGRVHKEYNRAIHFIPFTKYFTSGEVPYEWIHARGIDYHESRTPWSIGWLSASQNDEWFLWQEMHPAIDGPHAMNTYEIAKAIARRSGDHQYILNLIDPLACKKQSNTNLSVLEELNNHFIDLRKNDGIGTPTFWEGWDTHNTKGRDEIRTRFKNALKCQKPFNNTFREHGETKRLPTIWICDTCPRFDASIRLWSYQEWASPQSRQMHDQKPTVQQKNSHDNMVLECLAKDYRMLHWNRPEIHRPQQAHSVTGRPL
jgi:hypothetical protein